MGSSGIIRPGDVQVAMTSSAHSTEGSDGGERIADTKHPRTHEKTGRLGWPDHLQTEVRGLQDGQVVLLASNRYHRTGHRRSTLLCYGCIRHRVQGR